MFVTRTWTLIRKLHFTGSLLMTSVCIFMPLHSSAGTIKASYNFEASGKSSEDETNRNKIFGVEINSRIRYLFSDALYFKFHPSVELETGSIQSDDPNARAENKLKLREGSMNFEPSGHFRIAGGAINQSEFYSRFFILERAFPSVFSEVNFIAEEDHQAGIKAQQAIAIGTASDETQTSLNKTPTLQSFSIYSDSKSTYIDVLAQVSSFKYADLANNIATRSRYKGNTTFEPNTAESIFVYEYEGFEARIKTTLKPTGRLDLIAEGSLIQNNKVDAELGKATIAKFGIAYKINRNYKIELAGMNFKIAPDAMIADYAFAPIGFTNRNGNALSIALYSKDLGFKFSTEIADSEVMYTTPLQSRQKSILLKLETFYEKI